MPRLIIGVEAVHEQNFYLLEVTEVRITTKKGLKHNRFQALDFALDRIVLFYYWIYTAHHFLIICFIFASNNCSNPAKIPYNISVMYLFTISSGSQS